jgi:hypothetical protein
MAVLNFPTNPTTGQFYSIGSNTWQWNGVAWIKYNPLTVTTSTQSTSTTTGALVVTGGIGVGGSVNIGQPSTIGGAYILTTATLINSFTNGTDTTVTTTAAGQIKINDISTLQSVTNRGSITNNAISFTNSTASTSTTTGAVTITGGLGVEGDVYVGGTIVVEHIDIAEATMDSTYTEVNTGLATVIDQYPTNIYRSAKYLIQIDEGTGPTASFEVIELLLLVTNTGTVLATDYGLLTSDGELGAFSTMVDGSDPLNPLLKLYFTPNTASNKTITVLRTAVTK